MSYILGLDASYAQGSNINFAQAKAAGYDFWIQRMSYAYPGQGCKFDTTAARNYNGAKGAGFIVGGYHKVGWTDPIAEADFFVAAMSPLAEGDLLAYDTEPSSDVPVPANWAAWEQAFVQRLHDLTGVWPFDYKNISMANTMPRQGAVTNCGLWVAAPDFRWDAAIPVNGLVVIQQGPAIHIPGIPDNVCDTDAFFAGGSADELRHALRAYGYHAPQPPAAPPAPVPPEPASEPQPAPTPAPAPPSQPTPAPHVPQTPVTNVKPDITPPPLPSPKPTPAPQPAPTVVTFPPRLNAFQRFIAWIFRLKL